MLRSIRKKITTAVTNKSKAINQTFQSLKNLRITSDDYALIYLFNWPSFQRWIYHP